MWAGVMNRCRTIVQQVRVWCVVGVCVFVRVCLCLCLSMSFCVSVSVYFPSSVRVPRKYSDSSRCRNHLSAHPSP